MRGNGGTIGIGDEDAVVREPLRLVILPIPENNASDGASLAEVNLPPGLGQVSSVGDTALIIEAVDISVDGAGGHTSPAGGGLSGCDTGFQGPIQG